MLEYVNCRWQYERQWHKLLEKLRHQGKFHTRFRMSETAFNDLVELLRPALKRVVYNSRSKQPIFVELVVAIGLRWLAGGSYQEIEDVFGVSTTEAYRSRNKFSLLDVYVPVLIIAISFVAVLLFCCSYVECEKRSVWSCFDRTFCFVPSISCFRIILRIPTLLFLRCCVLKKTTYRNRVSTWFPGP